MPSLPSSFDLSDDIIQLTDTIRTKLRELVKEEWETANPSKARKAAKDSCSPCSAPWPDIKGITLRPPVVAYSCNGEHKARSFTHDTMTGEVTFGPEQEAQVRYTVAGGKNGKGARGEVKEVMEYEDEAD